jgi:hypothetical protein
VRCTEDELSAVQAHAAERGLSVSGYLRSVALDVAGQPVVSTRWSGRVATNSSLTDARLLLRNDEIVTYASRTVSGDAAPGRNGTQLRN